MRTGLWSGGSGICDWHLQGFPDEEGPEAMKRVAGDTLLTKHNQYPPMLGLPETRQVEDTSMLLPALLEALVLQALASHRSRSMHHSRHVSRLWQSILSNSLGYQWIGRRKPS